MAALATPGDLEAIAGPQTDNVRAQRLLEMASAVVERWCRRSFAFVANDVVTVTVIDGDLFLPNGPVTAVGAITGPNALAYAATAYNWSESGQVVLSWPAGDGHRSGGWPCGDYTVTYSHGYSPIPDDVVLAVCQPVQRHLDNPSGIRSETIGEAATVYTIPGTGYGLGLALSPVDKDLLRLYRRPVMSFMVSR